VNLILPPSIKWQIEKHGEKCYPEEGTGMLLGSSRDSERRVIEVLPMDNDFEAGQRGSRYQIRAEDMIAAEALAEERGLEVIGVFHSHPDHEALPSEFDRRNALPWFVYLITSIRAGHAGSSRAWLLLDDRDRFEEVRVMSEVNEESR
jgi:proteasome lid subunit RPN8/RPN11